MTAAVLALDAQLLDAMTFLLAVRAVGIRNLALSGVERPSAICFVCAWVAHA